MDRGMKHCCFFVIFDYVAYACESNLKNHRIPIHSWLYSTLEQISESQLPYALVFRSTLLEIVCSFEAQVQLTSIEGAVEMLINLMKYAHLVTSSFHP